MHRRLKERDEVAERLAGEGVDVSYNWFEVHKVVVGLHPCLGHLFAQAIESGEVGALGHLRQHAHDDSHTPQ